MTKTFDQNLELWAKEYPVDAMRLQNGVFDIPKWNTKKNLVMPWGLLYEKSPVEEAEHWFKHLNASLVKVLYVFGIGLGTYYLPLKKWLKEDIERQVIFIEDAPGVLHRFFETAIATEMLLDAQVTICFFNNLKDSSGVLETLYWSSCLAPFQITALTSYEKNKSSFFEELRYKISYDTTMKNALVEEYLQYGVAFFRNFYPNMLNLSGAYSGNALFGKFKGIPAVICGAGPSLEKHIDSLGTLKDRALIFAGGSSLNGLMQKGIFPHFGAGIDPNPTYLQRLKNSQMACIPFFYRTRMLAEAVQKIPGERLYVAGVGGYDIADFYEKKFGLEAEFLDEGHNVVNFCTEIALRMGCNPIIYVGMDLAFTGMKAYSKGIDGNEDLSEEELLNAKDEEFRGIYRTDIYGKEIITLWKWIAESDWLSRFSKLHPEVTFINATEGGIGFVDIENRSFKTVIEDQLKKTFSLKHKIQEEIQKALMPQVTKKALKEATEELVSSLEKCREYLGVLLNEIEKEKQNSKTIGSLSSGRALLAESDLYEEPSYIYILDIFHQVFARVQNKHVTQMRLNKKGVWTDQEIALKKLVIQEEKLIFLRNLTEANITLIHDALNKFD